jgi:predicted PurR-regulated permease PerM
MAVDEQQRPVTGEAERSFARRVVLAVLIAGGLIAFGLLLWTLVDVLLLVFGAVLVATMLHALADPIAERTPLSRTAALPLAALAILAVLGVTVWLFHAQVSGQIVDALSKAKSGLPALGERLGMPALAGQIMETAERVLSGEGLLGRVTTVGATLLEATANLVLVVFGGAYLAANPTVYRDGVVKLFPAAARPRVRDTLDAAGRALKLWLVGQIAAMIVTGLLTWLARSGPSACLPRPASASSPA